VPPLSFFYEYSPINDGKQSRNRQRNAVEKGRPIREMCGGNIVVKCPDLKSVKSAERIEFPEFLQE